MNNASVFKTITFEDKHQDFLEFITKDGVIVDCQPFQYDFWFGKEVMVDGNIAFYRDGDKAVPIRYPVEKVTETNSDYIQGFNDALDNKDLSNQWSKDSFIEYRNGLNVGKSFIRKTSSTDS